MLDKAKGGCVVRHGNYCRTSAIHYYGSESAANLAMRLSSDIIVEGGNI